MATETPAEHRTDSSVAMRLYELPSTPIGAQPIGHLEKERGRMREIEATQRMPAVRPVDIGRVETHVAPFYSKTELTASVAKLARAGQVRPLTPYPVYSAERGQWEHRVVRLKPAPPRWRKPLLIALIILTGLSILGALGYWLIMSLATLPLGLFLAAALVAIAVILRAGRAPSVHVQTHTSTYVRIK